MQLNTDQMKPWWNVLDFFMNLGALSWVAFHMISPLQDGETCWNYVKHMVYHLSNVKPPFWCQINPRCWWNSPPPATRSLRKPLVPASEEPWASDLQEKKATGGSSQLLWRMIFNNLSWVNYNSSLTWIKAIWGWFPLLTMIPSEVAVRSL